MKKFRFYQAIETTLLFIFRTRVATGRSQLDILPVLFRTHVAGPFTATTNTNCGVLIEIGLLNCATKTENK